MEEIKVGEYVRLSRNQCINKIIEIEDDKYILEEDIADEYGDLTCVLEKYQLKDEIEKHSKDIIDLIEVGDYVNGKLIHKIDKGQNYCYLYYGNCKTFVSYQIKTIVTHEQMSNIEYRLED